MTADATDLRQSLDELARACRILEMEGHGDMTLGHLSLRDPEGRGFWLKRNRIGLGEVMGAGDFVLVDWDGQQLAGSGGRHSEWPIHSEILRMRPDVHVVAHTHTPFMPVCSRRRSTRCSRSASTPTISSTCRATPTRWR